MSEGTFWIASWLGTTAAGGLFGGLFGCLPGAVVGGILAALIGGIAYSVAAVVAWSFFSGWLRLGWACAAGAATGVLSTLLFVPDEALGSSGRDFPYVVLAGLLGAAGAAIGGARFSTSAAAAHASGSQSRPIPRAYLAWRLALVAASIAAITAVVSGTLAARANARKSHCASMLRLVAISLTSYHNSYNCLPPAFVTDPSGKPVMSWRVLVGQYHWYDWSFRRELDFSEPWNSPKNAAFLAKLEPTNVFQCPAARNESLPITHYVAVGGPETLWPGAKSGVMPDESSGKKRILVVEWPPSKIHWAEPRDITVEEFLDWFRSKPPRSDSLHRGCIQYVDSSGSVGEIPNNADPDAVRKLLTGDDAANP